MNDLINRLQLLAKTYPTPGVEATARDTIAEIARLRELEQRWRNEYGEAMEQLRQRSAGQDALAGALSSGYRAGSTTNYEHYSVHLHYDSQRQAVAAFEAITDCIDAALAKDKP